MRFGNSGTLGVCLLVLVLLPTTHAPANPLPATGACCVDAQPCQVVTASQCLSVGGAWMGDFTTCDPDPCIGACCGEGGGNCSILDYLNCVTPMGIFMGYGTTCQPDPCHVGACCLPSGECVELDEGICVQQGGVFTDDFYPCFLDPCAEVGACCRLGDFSCVVTARDLCSFAFQGAGSTCIPNPCPLAEVGTGAIADRIPWTVAPNPFTRTTTLRFAADLAGPVLVQAVDVTGRVVWSAASERAGGSIEWDARDPSGRPVPAGAYFLSVRSGDRTWTRLVVHVD
jgi:hypothetical protein